MTEFSDLQGKTIMAIYGAEIGSDSIGFHCSDGDAFSMYHCPQCCEIVELNEIIGDIVDLIGSPITLAEVVTFENEPGPDGEVHEYSDSYTWSFYKLATVRGYVTLRWLGESNGYYSEEVSFVKVRP